MQLFAFGINHQTAPLSIREQVAFHAEAWSRHTRFSGHHPVKEAAILSTCNRTEIYCNTEDPTQAVQWLADFHHLTPHNIEPYLYTLPQDSSQTCIPCSQWLDSMVW